MRWLQAGTFAVGLVMYVLVFTFSDQLSSATYLHLNFFIVGYWNTILIVVTALVIRDSIRRVRSGQTRALATDALVVKLAAIPFFVLNFVTLAYLNIGGIGILIFGGVVLLFAAWVGSILTYLALLSTSVYTWAAIAGLRRDRTIGTGLAVLYTLLSLIFVTDVAAAALLFGHSRKRPGRALVVVLLTLGALLMLPAYLFQYDPDEMLGGLSWLFAFPVIGAVVILGTVAGAVAHTVMLRRRKRDALVAAETNPADLT